MFRPRAGVKIGAETGSLVTRKRVSNALLVVVALAMLSLLIVRLYGVRLVLFPTFALPKPAPRASLAGAESWTLETDQGSARDRATALLGLHR